MSGDQRHTDPRSYDVIVVGAGICGVVFRRYAHEEGLRCLAMEKQSQPGGVWHSSALLRPEDLAGKRATIVGGGASSWDLLDLAIAHGATDVHWVCRNVRWFLPTHDTKETAWPNLRELALMQSILRSPERVTAFLRWLLRIRYRGHRLRPLEPDEPFDIGKHQLN